MRDSAILGLDDGDHILQFAACPVSLSIRAGHLVRPLLSAGFLLESG